MKEVIKLKYINKDGEVKGRAYTYYSPCRVEVGDTVEIADGKAGIVTEIDVPREEIEKFGSGAKTIAGLWTVGTSDEEIMKAWASDEGEADTGKAEIVAFKSSVDISDTLITIEQLPILAQRLREVKEQIDGQVAEALALPVTEETKIAVKQVRADLNKQLTVAENIRKEIKRKILEPYDEVEVEFRECITNALKLADTTLKERIDEIENAEKYQKRLEVTDYYRELKEATGLDFIGMEDIGLNFTLTVTVSALKKQVKSFFDNVSASMRAIDSLADDVKAEVLLEYKKTFDLSGSIAQVSRRKRELEEQAAREEERKAQEAARQEKINEVNEIIMQEKITAPAANKGPEKDITVILRLTMKASQKDDVKRFFADNGIKAVAVR